MKKKIIGAAAAVIALVLVFSSLVVTAENQYTLVRQFGKISRVIDQPGLSMKIPFIQTTDTYPKQTLLYDLTPSEVITRDKKTMITDSYVLWTISEPTKFAQSLNGSVINAESRINTAVYNALKNAISSMNQDEVITSRDGELSEMVMARIDDSMNQYGIDLLMFETKQLDLPEDNKAAVYERMISERDNIAATYIAEGAAEGQVIRNTTDKDVSIMLSEAKKQAEILVAEGEAEYMRILSEAYNTEEKTEFYSFVRSLDALRESMTGEDKTVILPSDSPIAEIFSGYSE